MKNLERTIKTAKNLANNLMNTEIRLTYSTKENFNGKVEVFRPTYRHGLSNCGYTKDKKGRKILDFYMPKQEIHITVPVTEEKNVSYWYNKVFA